MVTVPDDDTMRAAFRGALLLLGLSQNWEAFGSMTADDAAELWQLANVETFEMPRCNDVVQTGSIIWGAWNTAPDGYLVCDGGLYATADYPDLFNIVGYRFGGYGATFGVPDLVDRVMVGAGGTHSLDDSGGQAEVTLTVDEMPNHSHDTIKTTAVQVQSGTGETVWGVVGGAGFVSYTGGGDPHDNMPPYLALTPAIKT
jgi:microcystin-dependent protein